VSYMPSLVRMLRLREAVASVSLSHPEACDCNVCKAAKGDEDAFVLLLDQGSSRTVGQEDR
jgi:hypothetical protein